MSLQVTVDRKSFAEALVAVRSVIEARNTIPILANVAIIVEGGGMVLRGTDLDIELTLRLPVELDARPGAITLPGSLLTDYVRKAATERVTLKLIAGGDRCEILAGRGKSVLNTLPLTDFPTLSAPGTEATVFSLPAATLTRLLSLTQFAISTEETRYFLNGIYLHIADQADGPQLTAVATDGHRLSRMRVPAPVEALPDGIVPRKTVATALKLLPKDGTVEITMDASKISLAWRGGEIATTLTSKLIDGTFPDYGRVIPSANPKLARLNREALLAGTDLVTTIQSDRGRAVRLTFEESGPLVLDVTAPDHGNAREEVDCTFTGEPVEIGFNGRYLRDAADTLEGRDIAFALADAGSPTVLTNHPDTGHLIVLMPMRV